MRLKRIREYFVDFMIVFINKYSTEYFKRSGDRIGFADRYIKSYIYKNKKQIFDDEIRGDGSPAALMCMSDNFNALKNTWAYKNAEGVLTQLIFHDSIHKIAKLESICNLHKYKKYIMEKKMITLPHEIYYSILDNENYEDYWYDCDDDDDDIEKCVLCGEIAEAYTCYCQECNMILKSLNLQNISFSTYSDIKSFWIVNSIQEKYIEILLDKNYNYLDDAIKKL
jgi:hypothetical protein